MRILYLGYIYLGLLDVMEIVCLDWKNFKYPVLIRTVRSVAAPEGRSRVGFSLCEAAERRRREERGAEGSRRRRRREERRRREG